MEQEQVPESPTIEIRRGLEALKLAGREERFAKDANPSLSSSTEEIKNLQQSAAHVAGPHPGPGGFRPSSDIRTRPNIQESRLVGVCSQHPQNEPQGISHSYVTCTYNSDMRTPVLSNQCNCMQHLKRDCATGHISSCIEESFTSLNVSSFPSSTHTNLVSESAPQPQVVMRTCREQAAAAYGNSFDDTTVDDLAGYLDEIMFIPKPMSEMAELMYT